MEYTAFARLEPVKAEQGNNRLDHVRQEIQGLQPQARGGNSETADKYLPNLDLFDNDGDSHSGNSDKRGLEGNSKTGKSGSLEGDNASRSEAPVSDKDRGTAEELKAHNFAADSENKTQGSSLETPSEQPIRTRLN